uniref:Vacuolar ATPase assembly integral membrane protein VMA21 homolog n=1 Tax=Anopheles culicifacies TaxID=139723 RepID=A0A182M6D4_9DIPT
MDNNTPSVPDRRQEYDDNPATQRETSSALGWLLLYSTAMFTLPFAAFYSTRYALTHYLHIDGFPNTCGSVVAAVLVVNLIILLYALRGYEDAKEDDNHTPPEDGTSEGKVESKKKQ